MFNQYMAVSPGTIESAKTLAEAGKDYGNTSTGVNCTGPFAFGSWKPGESITLKRYDDYWDPALKARSSQVEFVFLSDPNTRVNAWAAGQVDGGWQVPAESLVTRSNWEGASPDQVDSIYDALPAYGYDVAAAKALAKEAGVNGQRIVIATSPVFQSSDVIAAAVAQAAKEIGLDPKIESISGDKYTTLFTDPAARTGIDLFLTIWYTSLADPLEYYGVLRTGQFSNYGGWSSSEFDTHAEQAIGTAVEDPARTDLIAEAEQVAMEELPWLPLYTVPTSVWMGSRITGVQPSIAFLYYPWAAAIGAK
jgi:peptide/nickel transport system substrate-binding protein